jgi:oligopeptide transport system permease protein
MARYILKRLAQALASLLALSAITFILVYACVPRANVFKGDASVSKLANAPDELQDYKYRTWARLGYIDYATQKEFAERRYGAGSAAVADEMKEGSALAAEFRAYYGKRGYKVEAQAVTGFLFASRDVSLARRLGAWYGSLLYLDHPWRVQDPANPALRRGYYLTKDWNGLPALAASGTAYKYQIWLDGRFPFLHSHILNWDFGESYPSYQGQAVLKVIGGGQGRAVRRLVQASLNGRETRFYTTLDEHSLRYKPTLDRLELNKFADHYAEGDSVYDSPSMLETSFAIGTAALILSLFLGILMGVVAAMRKDKAFDRFTMGYVVLLSAIPTLLYVALLSRFGLKALNLPDKFPFQGAGSLASWVMPTLTLTIAGIAGQALWVRRYMVDQERSDYARFALAKGLSRREVFFKHILRNAIVPILHGIPGAVIGTLSGSIITESFYAVPGMGKMLVSALTEYDNPMIVALVFIFAAISILSILLGDLLVAAADPRVKLQAGREAR